MLARLHDWDDHGSWLEFFDTYWCLIYRVALQAGLTESEAQDAVQDTFVAVAKNVKAFDYEPARCSFKTWLMLITRQRVIWRLRKRLPLQAPLQASKDDTSRTSTVERIPDPTAVNLDAVWEEEWRKNLMTAALDRVKQKVSPRQYQIFDLYVLQNWSVGEIARTLRINAGRIYLAKHRVSAVLTKEVKKLEALAASQLPHQVIFIQPRG